MSRKFIVVETVPFWGSSHSETCYRICGPWRELGEDLTIDTSLVARADPQRILRPTLPRALPAAVKTRLHRWFLDAVTRRTENRAIGRIRPGDFCYFWPGTSLDAMQRARDAGAYVVSEFINSHSALSREILTREHLRWGFPPPEISTSQVEADDRRVMLSDSIFAPGPLVAPSIRSRHPSLGPTRIIETSYGCHVPDSYPDRSGRTTALTYLFVGSLGLRKGAPYLLNAWKKANLPGELWIAGNMEDSFRPLLAELMPDRVRLFPYIRDINSLYKRADVFVFPSLEEGGPQVTYEAASYGLPLIVTKAGGGWINTPQTAIEVADASDDALVSAMTRLADDRDLRLSLGQAARRASLDFAWDKVAQQRLTDLKRAAGLAS